MSEFSWLFPAFILAAVVVFYFGIKWHAERKFIFARRRGQPMTDDELREYERDD